MCPPDDVAFMAGMSWKPTAPCSSAQPAQWSLVPSLFNIKKLLVFGLPLALNPTYLVPFLVARVLSVLIGVAAVQSGLLPFCPSTCRG
jgi:cellobiose-specific phosphotransferase system component IIC